MLENSWRRSARSSLWPATLAILLVSCGNSGGGINADLSSLLAKIDETIARRTAEFTLEVAQTLPVAGPNGVSILRTGAFDDELDIGSGSLRFEAESNEIGDALGATTFDFRFVEGTFWLFNPLGDPPAWAGYGAADFLLAAEGDPLLSINGDLFLRGLEGAILEATDHSVRADNSETWSVTLSADDFFPLVTTGGLQNRLASAGLDSTGISAPATIRINADGMVTSVQVGLNEWWTEATKVLLPEVRVASTMSAEFELGEFDKPIHVESPCAGADIRELPGSPTGYTCDP